MLKIRVESVKNYAIYFVLMHFFKSGANFIRNLEIVSYFCSQIF